MFAYARMVASEVPAGSPIISVVASAHIEDFVARQRDMDIEEAVKSLGGPEVGDELREAAERSICHPDFVEDDDGLMAANRFMVAFYGGNHYSDCHRVLTLLRGRYCSRPIAYLGNPGRMCRKVEILTAREMGILRGPTRNRR